MKNGCPGTSTISTRLPSGDVPQKKPLRIAQEGIDLGLDWQRCRPVVVTDPVDAVKVEEEIGRSWHLVEQESQTGQRRRQRAVGPQLGTAEGPLRVGGSEVCAGLEDIGRHALSSELLVDGTVRQDLFRRKSE